MVILGWVGAIFLISAYLLLTTERINSRSKVYLFLNVFSSALLLISSYSLKAYFAVFLNGFWIVIAIYGLAKNSLKK